MVQEERGKFWPSGSQFCFLEGIICEAIKVTPVDIEQFDGTYQQISIKVNLSKALQPGSCFKCPTLALESFGHGCMQASKAQWGKAVGRHPLLRGWGGNAMHMPVQDQGAW